MEQDKNLLADSLLRTCLSSLKEYDTQGFTGAKYLMTSALCNLGACLNSQEKWNSAISCFEEARTLTKIVENQLHCTDGQTQYLVNNFFVSTYNLCVALEQSERHEEAFRLLNTVINDMKVEYGDKSPELIKPMFILASFCRTRGIKDYKRINKEAVQLAKEALGSNHLEYLKFIVIGSKGTKYTMFSSYEGEKTDFGLFEEWGEAREVLKETLKKLTKRLGKNHSLTIDCKFELARVLVDKQHFKKAEKYIKECVHYWKTVEAENDYKIEIRNAINLLLHLDREWYTIKIMTSVYKRLSRGQERKLVKDNYGDDRARTNRGYIIDEDSLFSFVRDVNDDDGYILSRKSMEDLTKHMDEGHCDNSLDDENNLDGVARSEGAVKSDDDNFEHIISFEGAVKNDDNFEGAVKSDDDNFEHIITFDNFEGVVKSDDKEC
jgi:tetratricopeptide (TPR) repeat protein